MSRFPVLLWLLVLANLIAFAWLFAGWAIGAGQDMNWDLLNYHWYNPWAWLNDRWDVDLQVAQRQTFFNPLLDVPFFLLAEAAGIRTASVALAVFQSFKAPALLVLAYAVGREGGLSRITSLVVAQGVVIVAILAPGHVEQTGSTFGDSTTATLVIAGVTLVLLAGRGHGRLPSRTRGVVGGLILGLATGLKLTNGPYLVAALVASLALAGGARERLGATAWIAFAGLAGFLVAYGYWGAFLIQETGNPFFPQFNYLFRSEFIGPNAFTDDRFDAPTFWRGLFYPLFHNVFSGSIAGQFFDDLRAAVALLLVPACGLLALRSGGSPPLSRALVVFAVTAYVLWLLIFPIIRYLMALEVLVPVVLLAALGMVGSWSRLRLALAMVLCAAIVISGLPRLTRQYPWGPRSPWTETPFEVRWPDGLSLDGTMVLVAGGEPASFLVPAAPPATPFVRINSNLFYGQGFETIAARYDNGVGRLLTRMLAAHRGPFLALFVAREEAYVVEDLAHFGLRLDRSSCAEVVSKFRQRQLLCAVDRASN